MMNNVQIDLRLPFEENIKRALALSASARRQGEGEMIGAVRRLYELAHGRSVQTTLGLIPIAPAVAPSLSRRTFLVAIRSELHVAATNPAIAGLRGASTVPAEEFQSHRNL